MILMHSNRREVSRLYFCGVSARYNRCCPFCDALPCAGILFIVVASRIGAAVRWRSVRGGADSSPSARGLEARAPRVRNDNRYGGLSGGGYFAVCTLPSADFGRPQRKALICAPARGPPAGG